MASLSLAPVNIFKAGADEERAETARLSSFIGAIAVGDLVKSTLGPKGMDKILLSSGRDASLMVTNDGATILKNIGIDNPAAKVLVDMSRVQDDEVGDGTTSVTVLAAELLREAESLIAKKLHPQTIIAGWREATKAAREALLSSAVDHGSDEAKFRQDLLNIAGTTLSSKLLTHHKDHFTKLAVEAVLRLKGSGNLEAIHVIKKLGGSLADSYLDEEKKIGTSLPWVAKTWESETMDQLIFMFTGGEIASTFDHPELVKLGSCKLIEEVMIGEDKLIHFSGVALGEACTIVLRGATQQILDEAERSLHDVINMKEGTIGDMALLGITESFQVKRQVLLSAAEAAEVILRVDNIIKAAPRKRVPDHHPC
ncbi:T-complex protein 1 subunit beta [Octodon degus]|uniref:T-complex protein 1 subunit beta n=1 Tax=Octodon degus TaxID=10160 RepID=A0A6P6EI98_OCTDE|nr:T-complex protein 1 subunit beta [Octodon degus]